MLPLLLPSTLSLSLFLSLFLELRALSSPLSPRNQTWPKSKSRCTPTRSARFSLITVRSRDNFVYPDKDPRTSPRKKLLSLSPRTASLSLCFMTKLLSLPLSLSLSLSLSIYLYLSACWLDCLKYIEITLTFSARVDLEEEKVRPKSVSTLMDRFESLISKTTARELRPQLQSYSLCPCPLSLSLSLSLPLQMLFCKCAFSPFVSLVCLFQRFGSCSLGNLERVLAGRRERRHSSVAKARGMR